MYGTKTSTKGHHDTSFSLLIKQNLKCIWNKLTPPRPDKKHDRAPTHPYPFSTSFFFSPETLNFLVISTDKDLFPEIIQEQQ